MNSEDRAETIRVVQAICDERDRRYEERWQAQQEAILTANQASERRFESVNEFRAQQTDLIAGFLPRKEYQVQHDAVNDRIEALRMLHDVDIERLTDKVDELVNEVTTQSAAREGAASAIERQRRTIIFLTGVMGVLIAVGTLILAWVGR